MKFGIGLKGAKLNIYGRIYFLFIGLLVNYNPYFETQIELYNISRKKRLII
jgi:hypothetical protein